MKERIAGDIRRREPLADLPEPRPMGQETLAVEDLSLIHI